MQTQFESPTRMETFELGRYQIQHEQNHKPSAATCALCHPHASFQSRSALVSHRPKVHGALPHLCVKERCEEAFATNAELQVHWKENHSKCDRCCRVISTPAGLKLHQKKCVDYLDSIDSGVASGELRSRDSGISEISIPSSSLRSNESRHRKDYTVAVKASCFKQITPDMRHVVFGLPTASTALIFVHARGIGKLDGENLDKILRNGQSLFRACARPSDPLGPVSPSQMQERIRIELWDVLFILTYSPDGVPNPPPKFIGRLNRNEVFKDLTRFSKECELGVLGVGDFYMALVFENDFLHVVNPGIGTSNPVALATLMKCHRRGWHALVDELIDSFKIENKFSDQLEYVMMPAFISYAD